MMRFPGVSTLNRHSRRSDGSLAPLVTPELVQSPTSAIAIESQAVDRAAQTANRRLARADRHNGTRRPSVSSFIAPLRQHWFCRLMLRLTELELTDRRAAGRDEASIDCDGRTAFGTGTFSLRPRSFAIVAGRFSPRIEDRQGHDGEALQDRTSFRRQKPRRQSGSPAHPFYNVVTTTPPTLLSQQPFTLRNRSQCPFVMTDTVKAGRDRQARAVSAGHHVCHTI
jgi:hypothetical protein